MSRLKLIVKRGINGILIGKRGVQLSVKLRKYTNKHLKQLIGCKVLLSHESGRKSNLKLPMVMAVFSFQKNWKQNNRNPKRVRRIFENHLSNKLHLHRLLEIHIKII